MRFPRLLCGVAAPAALFLAPCITAAQSPLADAIRDDAKRMGTNLTAAADEFPADKYSYKPTPAQMTVGDIMAHLAEGNDYLCGEIGGMKAPQRSKVSGTDTKDVLLARLKESFSFCDQALASSDDSKLTEQLPFFGGRTRSRAGVILVAAGDWADHYSQLSNYLRLNGMLPPTAKKKAA